MKLINMLFLNNELKEYQNKKIKNELYWDVWKSTDNYIWNDFTYEFIKNIKHIILEGE